MLMVKLSLAVLSSFAVIGVLSGSADDVLPPRFNFDRYTRMVDQSPFAIATAAALPEATPNFAKDLYVANAARSPDGDMVTIMSSSDHNFKKYLSTREPVDGYSIAQIEWSEDVGKTKVTISKDGQFATLTFNQSLLSQTASAGRPVANRMPSSVPIIHSPGADQASRARARGGPERNSKIAFYAEEQPDGTMVEKGRRLFRAEEQPDGSMVLKEPIEPEEPTEELPPSMVTPLEVPGDWGDAYTPSLGWTIASAPSPKAAAASPLEAAMERAMPVPPPVAALPNPLGDSQELAEKEQQ
jgi:hypothetical protein